MSSFKYQETNLYYETYGEGQPILLIHGWGIDHHYFTGCMQPIFEKMAMPLKRYYVDLPGMGQSTPGTVKKADDIIEVLIGFMKEVIGEQPVWLIGNSFGGLISCGIAQKVRSLVKGMILIAPTTGCKKRTLPKQGLWKKDEKWFNQLSPVEQEDFAFTNAVLTKESWQVFNKFIYTSVLRQKDSVYLNQILDGTLSVDLYTEKILYEGPVLWVTGKQDICVGYEDQYRLAKRYPESTYIAINGAGHNLWVDQYPFFSQIISAWLQGKDK